MNLQIKRIYQVAQQTDGYRILVDRLWPRGISKQRAALQAWMKDLAPSPQLREWFDHKPERFAHFREDYLVELDIDAEKQKLARDVLALAQKQMVTLLYAAKNPQVNHAVVLLEFLQQLQQEKTG